MRRMGVLVFVVLMLAACTTAAPVQNGGSTVGVGIAVGGSYARAAEDNNGATYMILRNVGNQSDRLVGATSDVAGAVELHMVENTNGVMAMRPVDGIDVPAGGTVELKPGGYHVMLIGLKQPLAAGDRFSVMLQFERTGEVEVLAEVRNQ